MMSNWLLSIQVCAVPYIYNVGAEWSGKTKDDEDVSGTITVPEVAHDTEEDEYVVRPLVPLRRPCIPQLISPV